MPDKYQGSLIPPEGHKDVGNAVMAVLGEIIDDKETQGLHERWNKNYKLRRTHHWETKSSAALPLATANLVFTHIERTKNELTDNNPTFDVAQIGQLSDEQKGYCNDLQKTAEYWWIDQEQQGVLERNVLDGETYGVTIAKGHFNPDLEYGIGEAETEVVDPFYFGWYPPKLKDPRDINNPSKCEAVVHFYPKSVRYLRRKYPDLAAKIKPTDDILSELNDSRREINSTADKGKGQSVTMSGIIKNVINYITGESGDGEDETILCEMWLRDGTMTQDEGTVTDDQGRTVQESRSKYTGGIRYILVCGEGVVLEDRDNPNINPNLPRELAAMTYLYDKFPFSAVNSIVDTSNAWGFSDIETAEGLQHEINKALSQMILEKDRMIRAKLLNPKDSGVENSELTNYVSAVRPASQMAAQGIRWLSPPPPTGDVERTMEIMKSLMLLILGTFDLDTAQTGQDVIAYKAIAALLERAATMKRGKIRNYGRLIREVGKMYLSMVQNFYTEERWISFNDENGEKTAKPVLGTNMIIPVKLTVVTGSTLPISKVQQREEALELGKMGFLDQEEVLLKLDYSNRNEVIKRTKAGPLAGAFEALQKAGVPDELLQYFKALVQTDPKDLDKALQEGQLPAFPQVAQAMIAQAQGQPEQPPETDYEAMKTEAEVQKLKAEAALTAAKIQTEAVDQKVKLAGVDFDEQNMILQRAKAVAEMESNIRQHGREDMKAGAEVVSTLNNRPGYEEKGLSSNNQGEE